MSEKNSNLEESPAAEEPEELQLIQVLIYCYFLLGNDCLHYSYHLCFVLEQRFSLNTST